MFYPIDYSRDAAKLSRILAEDSGAPELRNPMLCTRKPLRLRLPKWKSPEKVECRPCACPKVCTAGSH